MRNPTGNTTSAPSYGPGCATFAVDATQPPTASSEASLATAASSAHHPRQRSSTRVIAPRVGHHRNSLLLGDWLRDRSPFLRTFVLATIAVPIVICGLMPQLHKGRVRLLTKAARG